MVDALLFSVALSFKGFHDKSCEVYCKYIFMIIKVRLPQILALIIGEIDF